MLSVGAFRLVRVLVNARIRHDHGRFGDDRDVPCCGMKLTRAVGELPGAELRRLPRNRHRDRVFQRRRRRRRLPARHGARGGAGSAAVAGDRRDCTVRYFQKYV